MPTFPAPQVDAVMPAARPLPPPRIYWPSVTGFSEDGGDDADRFPSLQATKARYRMRPPESLRVFVETVAAAEDQVLILDDYLFNPPADQSPQLRYDQILAWLPDHLVANEVRLLTSGVGERADQDDIRRLLVERADRINRLSPLRRGQVSIEVRFSLGQTFPYVHDRFAIIDRELWHFGATVGGLHERVNAASRGWDAVIHDAVRFFNEAWAGDGDQKRGRHA